MTLVPAPRYSLAQVADQRPRNHRRQGSAHHDAALRAVHFDGFQINPPHDAHELVAQLNRDAFNEMAIDRQRLGQAGRLLGFTHKHLPVTL